jgi:hypothetical protein
VQEPGPARHCTRLYPARRCGGSSTPAIAAPCGSLKTAMLRAIAFASSRRVLPASLAWLTMAAFCCVTRSSCATPVLTSARLADCSRALLEMPSTCSEIVETLSVIAPKFVAGAGHEFHALFHVCRTVADQPLDLVGGGRGPLGQRPHLVGHDRKAASGLAGSRRLDARVERKQVGLERDLVDDGGDAGDLPRRLLDPRHGIDGLLHDLGRFRRALARVDDDPLHILGAERPRSRHSR